MLFSEPKIPQSSTVDVQELALGRFSALQRAENSSMLAEAAAVHRLSVVSVLFSEPKIPQLKCVCYPVNWNVVSVLFSEPKIPQFRHTFTSTTIEQVSVLFSEPKIPQSKQAVDLQTAVSCFSALQRAENSSINNRARG